MRETIFVHAWKQMHDVEDLTGVQFPQIVAKRVRVIKYTFVIISAECVVL